MKPIDYLIIGGGIIGVNMALHLKRRNPGASICVVDKEPQLGLHGSGRNSGVVHSGFYYTSNSLKARFTRDGNIAMKNYIRDRKIPLNECGKLVVAKDESELSTLDELLQRGHANGVDLVKITEKDAQEIEPRVKTCQYALWSPNTATANPVPVLDSFKKDAEELGIEFHCSEPFVRCEGNRVWTKSLEFDAGYVVNAAGLYADQVAHSFGFGKNYAILPFKGLYLKSNEPVGSFKTNIYPVPNLKNPFLGVHVTVTVDGHHKIGPTAIPAFWREQYKGMENFDFGEFFQTASLGTQLMLKADFDFRRLACEELRKYNRAHLVELSQELATGLEPSTLKKWGPSGIRAQLLNLEKKSLEMDFVFEGNTKSFHVLNAVSPGWTCSIPFTNYMVDEMEKMQSNKLRKAGKE
ncbi:NAD(P)/FAD-dependent oxidoreductase [Pontiella sulfatireligans]|uniref:L-2-hydroxyglutarate oxidase LhgO n=1 Tax=Pontiella sulfatireligans TaxID=2750658 RepID=A0A6C2UNM2_9BACT|nr:FAD-dependent oxidoreductase [Pontiella sulfatireligans]VGO21659.1 L-2-hydroxyglutarate oxidase LhgO [Pontiella sulfatireligans]